MSSKAPLYEKDPLALVDSVISERVVVFGSIPPRGRDLDLLVGAADEAALRRELPDHGFLAAGGRWARFRDCTADIVDPVRIDTWELPEEERSALFSEARPLADANRLTEPSPHHVLLILARRLSRGAKLGERRRAQVQAALAEDPDAFARAWERADRWGLPASLAALERAHAGGRGLIRKERFRVSREWEGGRGLKRARRRLRRVRRGFTASRRGVLITFSGLDGSGKSSQTRYLRDTLDRLGYHAVAVWEPIAHVPEWLRATTGALSRLLLPFAHLLSRRRERHGAAAGGEADEAGTEHARARDSQPPGFAWPSDHPVTRLRRRSGLLTFGWTMTITLQFAYRIARATLPQLARGRVVVCDRYTLDSWVYLLYKFGDHRRYTLQMAILRALSPKPGHAYLLDLPPAVASARKSDFVPERNERRAGLYLERLDRLGIRRLDGTRPADEVSAEVAAEVWASLRDR
jgi:thymidylate kinase